MNPYARIFDVKHYAVHDGPGIRTTFFLVGCPLRCLWCQNPESWDEGEIITYSAAKCIGCGKCSIACGKLDAHAQLDRNDCDVCGKCVSVCPSGAKKYRSSIYVPEDILKTVLPEKAFFDASGGGVTFSGGECLLHPEFLSATLRLLQNGDIHTAIDTCGAVPWDCFDKVLSHTDLFLYDIKLMDSALHRKYTGMDNQLILDNLHKLCHSGANVIVRIPLIPHYTDSPEAISAIGAFIRDKLENRIIRCELLPYNKLAATKYNNGTIWRDYSLGAYPLPDMEPQNVVILRNLCTILSDYGIPVFCESLQS